MSPATRIPFFRPEIDRQVLRDVVESVDLAASSAIGPATLRCEAALGTAFGGRALLTSGATSALEALAFVLRARGFGRAIVPSYAHVSCASAFDLAGYQIDFVDVGPDGRLDVASVERAEPDPSSVLVALHYAGLPCDVPALVDVADGCGAVVVEDLAHSVGSRWGTSPPSGVAAGVTSFHLTKELSAGEAGAAIVYDDTLFDELRRFRDRGTNRSDFEAGRVAHYSWVARGSSIAPSELTATVLLHQLRRRPAVIGARSRVIGDYLTALGAWADRHGAIAPYELRVCGATNTFFLVAADGDQRERLTGRLATAGVGTAIHFVPLHRSPMVRSRSNSRALGGAEWLFERLLRLPLHSSISTDDVDRIADVMRSSGVGRGASRSAS